MSARITWKELKEKFPLIYERERAKEGRPNSTASSSRGKRTASATLLREAKPGETGPWIVEIPGWVPPSINRYHHGHWAERSRVKKRAGRTVSEACFLAGVPRATTRRRLSIRLTLPRGRKAPDEDNIGKALRDGLTACGAIVDDAPEWIETGTYATETGELKTTLTLEDV